MPEGKYGAPGPQFVQLYEKIQVHAADAQDLIGKRFSALPYRLASSAI